MIKFYSEPDEQLEIAIYSNDNNHKSLLKKIVNLLGYDFDEISEEETYLDVFDVGFEFDRDTIILKSNLFTEELLDFSGSEIGVYII